MWVLWEAEINHFFYLGISRSRSPGKCLMRCWPESDFENWLMGKHLQRNGCETPGGHILGLLLSISQKCMLVVYCLVDHISKIIAFRSRKGLNSVLGGPQLEYTIQFCPLVQEQYQWSQENPVEDYYDQQGDGTLVIPGEEACRNESKGET